MLNCFTGMFGTAMHVAPCSHPHVARRFFKGSKQLGICVPNYARSCLLQVLHYLDLHDGVYALPGKRHSKTFFPAPCIHVCMEFSSGETRVSTAAMYPI
jgi:hypothetical protein